jgi:hypothetical protein
LLAAESWAAWVVLFIGFGLGVGWATTAVLDRFGDDDKNQVSDIGQLLQNATECKESGKQHQMSEKDAAAATILCEHAANAVDAKDLKTAAKCYAAAAMLNPTDTSICEKRAGEPTFRTVVEGCTCVEEGFAPGGLSDVTSLVLVQDEAGWRMPPSNIEAV